MRIRDVFGEQIIQVSFRSAEKGLTGNRDNGSRMKFNQTFMGNTFSGRTGSEHFNFEMLNTDVSGLVSFHFFTGSMAGKRNGAVLTTFSFFSNNTNVN